MTDLSIRPKKARPDVTADPDSVADAAPGVSRRLFVMGGAAGAAVAVTQGGALLAAAGPAAAAVGAVAASARDLSVNGAVPVDTTLLDVDAGQLPQETSTFFSTVFIEHAGTYAAPGSDGDLWPTCWGDDDYVYAANGDGRGFSDEPFRDLVVSRIAGTPETGLSGEKLAESEEVAKVWADPTKYNRKPTGMVCVGGVLYIAVQDLRFGEQAFDDVPNASISRSDDHGKTWKQTDAAMFTDYRFTTIFFLDFGKNSENAKRALGARDGAYVYAYGMDWNWRTSNAGVVPDPVSLYLARVPEAAVQDRSQWTFFAGTDRGGRPVWSAKITDKRPVLHDPLRRYVDTQPGKYGNLSVISQGSVIYNAPLNRYIYSSWSDPSFELYEAPAPWGPWKRFKYHNVGLVPWYQMGDVVHTPKNGGYGTVIPTKYISADGRTMWMQTNWWTAPYPKPEDNYNFNLRKVIVAPATRARVNNRRGSANLARTAPGVTPLEICAFEAHWQYYNDGDLTRSEKSEDGTNKNIDFWGYTFPAEYKFNRVDYTTGVMEDRGGWFTAFGGGLRVQVRQDFEWVDVALKSVTPPYPYDRTTGSRTTYRMQFDTVSGDGIRIIGQPGGSGHFTSIAELGVYYE